MQYSPLAAPGLIVFLIINLAFYGACIALVVAGWRGMRRSRGDIVYIMLGIAPFLYYAYASVSAHSEEGQRAREVASWPRKPVTPDTRPSVLVVMGSSGAPNIARALVAAGPFQKAFAYAGHEGWYVYERIPGPDCPLSEPPRVGPGGRASVPCASAAKSAAPEIEQIYLQLLLDSEASYYKTSDTTGVTAGSILELRWSENAGGEIVAFYERPTFRVPAFPPLLAPNGFLRTDLKPLRYQRSPYAYDFVLDAIGFRR
jgi:hypothetical protein